MSTVEYSTTTEGETMTDTLIWTVPKFLDILDNKSTRELRMEKPKDAARAAAGYSRFHLKLRFLGQDNDIIEFFYLSPISVILKLEFKIIYKCNSRAYNDERVIVTKVNYCNQENQWQHLSTLLKRDILDNCRLYLTSNSRNPNTCDTLRLKIHFTIHKKYDLCYSNVEKSKVAEAELSHDFGELFTSEVFSDITMKSVEGNEYKAHKAILASRSVVLKSYFEHNTKECHTNIIVSHFESEILKEVLMFVYSNKVMKVDEIPEKLLAAADFYQLSTLKSWCEEALSKKLTTENVIETLELAELYSAENLIQSAIAFITHGETRQIVDTEGWDKLNSVGLLKKIFKSYIMADVNY